MKHLLVFLSIATLFGFLFVGCDGQQGAVTDQSLAGVYSLSNQGIVTSATLYLTEYETYKTDGVISAYGVLKEWHEGTVTYNNFILAAPPAYDPTSPVGSSPAGGPGLWSIDVTSLVKAWASGMPNYGILLDEGLEPYTKFFSSEGGAYGQRPYLVITFLKPDGTTSTLTIREGDAGSEVEDAYVWQFRPDGNPTPPDGGPEISLYWLFTGNVMAGEGNYKKVSLLWFNVEHGSGCSRTIGYWKTHAGFNRQPDVVTQLLPIDIGKEVYVANATDAVNVLEMKTYGNPSNGITKLYAQMLGAWLNIAAGAAPGTIGGILDAAHDFLQDHGSTDWKTLSVPEKAQILLWQSELDAYNNGLRGVAHCD